MPNPQPLHALAPEAEYCPAAHPTQVADTDAPVDDDDVPAPQFMQAVAPASVWYWPDGQLVQLVWPTATWYQPTVQPTHAVAPLEPWYWPAAHP